jgi:molybdopterin molybdotransferase
MISLEEAHRLIGSLPALTPVATPLVMALGHVCAEDVYAVSNCPSVDSSLKDGFAVFASDIDRASPSAPVVLSVIGSLVAGDESGPVEVTSGKAVRIMTGAPIPPGATSVVAAEFTKERQEDVAVTADAGVGRNILSKGSDITKGQRILKKGTTLSPGHLGLLASAGVGSLLCYPFPRVAIAATGSELVWPGDVIGPGKVAASNMVTASAELLRLGIDASSCILRDNLDRLEERFGELVEESDLLITCGGVLDGDKDLTMKAMERLGMEKIFHRVRIGPGKGACLGRIGNTVVFNLPGGPPSNHVALVLLALPGCRRLMGFENCFPQKRNVVVGKSLTGQKNWTQLTYCRVSYEGDQLMASLLPESGRLERIGEANALVELPEGCEMIESKSHAGAWILAPEQVS